MSKPDIPDDTVFVPASTELGAPYTVTTVLAMIQMPGGEWNIVSITDSEPIYCSLRDAQMALGQKLTELALKGETVRLIAYNYPGFENE
jgi:hypothetical protein